MRFFEKMPSTRRPIQIILRHLLNLPPALPIHTIVHLLQIVIIIQKLRRSLWFFLLPEVLNLFLMIFPIHSLTRMFCGTPITRFVHIHNCIRSNILSSIIFGCHIRHLLNSIHWRWMGWLHFRTLLKSFILLQKRLYSKRMLSLIWLINEMSGWPLIVLIFRLDYLILELK